MDAEMWQTPARCGVGSFPMGQMRPSCATRAGGHLCLFVHGNLICNLEKFLRIQNF